MQENARLKTWQQLSPSQQAQVRAIRISAAQTEFAGCGAKQLAAVENEASDQLVGLAILDVQSVVGFLVLKRGAALPIWARVDAALISGMRIDSAHQGRGLGSAALVLLREWVKNHWRDCVELLLTVDDENHGGIRAYQRAGFEEIGKPELGRIGLVRMMRMAL
jgi:ribosomal protein S18 acetylase RimI-like enzyme